MLDADVSHLLSLIDAAHQHLREENQKLLKDNERLNSLLSDKSQGDHRGDQNGLELHADSICLERQPPSTHADNSCVEGRPPSAHEDSSCAEHRFPALPESSSRLASSESKLIQSSLQGNGNSCSEDEVQLGEVLEEALEDAGLIPEGCTSTQRMQTPAFSVTDSEAVHWCTGDWVDLSGKFFAGATVSIDEHDWYPQGDWQDRKQVSEYSVRIDRHADVVYLVEHRSHDDDIVFKVQRGQFQSDKLHGQSIGKSLVVCLEGKGTMTWTLHARSPTDPSLGIYHVAGDLMQELKHEKSRPARANLATKLPYVEFVMCFAIECNLICFGITLQLGLNGRTVPAEVSNVLQCLDIVTLVIFMVDIGVFGIFYQSWTQKEFMFNVSVTAAQLIYEIIRIVADENYLGLQAVVLLRCFRLLRATRLCRSLGDSTKETWRLTHGLRQTYSTMIAMLAMLLLILYVFACIGLLIITESKDLNEDEALRRIIEKHFDNLAVTMITLFQFVTVDGVNEVYAPLIKANPYLVFYFLPILLMVSISLMNMVTGVIVEGALTSANNDREYQRQLHKAKVKEEAPIFQTLFSEIPKQDTSVLYRTEFERLAPRSYSAVFQQFFHSLNVGTLGELFDLVDDNDDNKLTEEQFVTGMLDLRIAAQQEPQELHLIHKLARNSFKKIRMLESITHEMQDRQTALWASVSELRDICTGVKVML